MASYNTVLVVDDDDIVREIVHSFMSSIGANIILQARNGAQANECIEQQHDDIDLVICDLVMPKSDGFEVIQKLKEKRYKGALAIITSASDMIVKTAEKLLVSSGMIPEKVGTGFRKGSCPTKSRCAHAPLTTFPPRRHGI